jgi:nucleotide-binding universal stress UspA family protein
VATIVVGVEDSFRAEDAVALAADLARTTDAEVLTVSVYRFDDRPSEHYTPALRPSLEHAAERTLDRVSEPLSQGSVRRVAVADISPARALMRAAAAAEAELIVIGSSHGEFTGRLRPGSTAWRLLQGAPCAVALAPQGYRLRPHTTFGRVTAAFDGSPGGYAALSTAARIADATHQRLRVVRVFEAESAAPPWLHDSPGFLRLVPDAERAARSALERAVTGHPGAEVAFLAGDPARELARETEISDLLVIGSRSYGPNRVVVLGGVSDDVLRTATCPVLIVPTGVAMPLSGVFPSCGKVRMGSADAPGSRSESLPVAS